MPDQRMLPELARTFSRIGSRPEREALCAVARAFTAPDESEQLSRRLFGAPHVAEAIVARAERHDRWSRIVAGW
jgi:hypothetical protein